MAASPISIAPLANAPIGNLRRRPIALTSQRIEANRRNAARSTGPRTSAGKARVAKNAIKHGYFAGHTRWTPQQHRDFVQTLDGLRDDFRPQGVGEESCVWMVAHSYIRMAALWRYENIAALKYHQECERDLNERIAEAEPAEAERLKARREQLRRAGLWKPTIPGPREAMALLRYQGRLDRTIRGAMADMEGLKSMRGAAPSNSIVQKQTHFSTSSSRPGAGPDARPTASESAKTNPLRATVSNGPEALRRTSHVTYAISENEKTNPLSSMFMGNRHQRRRARALARHRT